MNKKLRVAGIIGALIASIIIITSPGEPIPLPEPTTTIEGTKSVQVLVTDLDQPRAIAFGDERIFVTEKIGRVRVIQNDVLLDEPLVTLRTADVFGGGLLGIEPSSFSLKIFPDNESRSCGRCEESEIVPVAT